MVRLCFGLQIYRCSTFQDLNIKSLEIGKLINFIINNPGNSELSQNDILPQSN